MPITLQMSMALPKEFNVRRVLCDTHRVTEVEEQVEGQWLEALLLRSQVPKLMLKRKYANRMGNAQWRDYLFDQFQLNIYKNLSTKQVKVYKWRESTNENILVGEWSRPEVVRKKQGRKTHCELRLRYWHIV
jgi:hypothetical protein